MTALQEIVCYIIGNHIELGFSIHKRHWVTQLRERSVDLKCAISESTIRHILTGTHGACGAEVLSRLAAIFRHKPIPKFDHEDRVIRHVYDFVYYEPLSTLSALQFQLPTLEAFKQWESRGALDPEAAEQERLAKDAAQSMPEVPAQCPAALDPFWKEGRITVSIEPATTELTIESFKSALSGLQQELHKFAKELSGEANIDQRFVSFLRSTADLIPDTSPPQDLLFRLGHVEEVFLGYAEIVNEEWPAFLARRYHAMMLHYDRTMRQSPVWRDFKHNAAQQTLSQVQIQAAIPLAIETVGRLRHEEAPEFVDQIVPDSLEKLAECLERSELSRHVMESSYEMLAIDLCESINNILKRIAEAALTAGGSGTKLLDQAGKSVVAAVGDYGKGFASGFRREATRQGPKDGEKAFKWLRRITITGVVAGSAVEAGAFTQLAHLIANYSVTFKWLEHVQRYLQSL